MAATLSGKIREEVAREEALRAQKESIRQAEMRLGELVGRPSGRGKSRLKAHRGELETRVYKSRLRRRMASRSRARNR